MLSKITPMVLLIFCGGGVIISCWKLNQLIESEKKVSKLALEQFGTVENAKPSMVLFESDDIMPAGRYKQ